MAANGVQILLYFIKVTNSLRFLVFLHFVVQVGYKNAKDWIKDGIKSRYVYFA